MIEVRNVWKKYRNYKSSHWVLKDVDFFIPDKVSVGLIGGNGAGKSTLLRIIGGMDSADKGKVVRRCSVSWPIGLSGGFQGSMTGRQNAKFVARVFGKSDDVDRILENVQSFADIGESFDRPVATYSSGMKARFAFGLSLSFDFDVYLSDEATAVGDNTFKEKAVKAFKEKVGKKSIVIVSHQEGILKELCQSGVVLRQGEAIWFDDINQALNEYKRMRND